MRVQRVSLIANLKIERHDGSVEYCVMFNFERLDVWKKAIDFVVFDLQRYTRFPAG